MASIGSKKKRRRRPRTLRPSRRPNIWAEPGKPLNLDEVLLRASREAPTPIVPGGPVVGWIVSAIGWFKLLPFWAKFLIGIAASAGLFYFAQLFRKPAFDGSETRTYGFDAPRNTTGVGAAIPIVYGRHKVFGHIVQAFIETINDDQFYNILLCLSEGEINSIGSVEINDQPIANFADVQTETRLGTAGQGKIPWFDDTRTTRSHGVALNNDATSSTFTTVATNITAFIVSLKFPSGLYTLDGNGNLKSNRVTVTLEYRVVGAGSWTSHAVGDIREAKRNQFSRTGLSSSPLAFRVDNLAAGQYEIRITRNSTEDRSASSAFDMTYDTVDEITYGNTNFPNIALLGVRIRASEQLSGGLPPISCIVEGRKVRTRSGGAWTGEVYNRNPVWCIVDAITNTRYGMGNYIVDADLDIPALESAATTCDELVDDLASGTHVRHRLDMVLDQQGEAWDVIDRMLRTFRASIIESDNKYRLIIDKAGTVSQAFGNANMVRDSFVNGWVSLKEEFNQVEVVFFDEANDWIRETVRFPSSVGSPKLKTIELQGITRRAHAVREAKYHMNTVSALSRYIEFDAFLEGLAVEVGDIIEVSHDVPQWGYNGRVVAAVLNGVNHDITVDRDDLPTPTAHSMLMRHDDDVVESRSVISKTGRVVKCSAFSKVPVARDSVFMYGPNNATSKKFRVMQMGLTKELRAHLVGIEYDEAIYDATGLVLPARSPSSLPIVTAPPGSVTGLTLVTQLVRNNQGMDTTRLQIHWNNPVWVTGQGQYHHAQIWLSTDGGNHYQKIGEALDAPFYTPVIPLATYYIKVVAVSTTDVAQALSAAPSANLLITGDTTAPATVTGLTAIQGLGLAVNLDWDDNTEADLEEYLIYRNTVDNSGTATLIVKVRASRFIDGTVKEGTKYFYWVRAVDFSGNGSAGFGSSVSIIPLLIDPITEAAFIDHFNYAADSVDPLDPDKWKTTKESGGTIKSTSSHEILLQTSATTDGAVTLVAKKMVVPQSGVFPSVRFTARVIIDAWASGADFIIGMVHDVNTAGVDWGVIGGFARVQRGTNTNTIKFVTQEGALGAVTTDNIAVNPNSYHEYVIEIDAGGAAARLYVDGVLQATHTTEVPTTAGQVHFHISQSGTTNRKLTADYVVAHGVR